MCVDEQFNHHLLCFFFVWMKIAKNHLLVEMVFHMDEFFSGELNDDEFLLYYSTPFDKTIQNFFLQN